MKIVVLHPNLMVKGGAEFVAVNFLDAFSNHKLILVTGVKPDFKVLERAFKVHLSPANITVSSVPLYENIPKLTLRRAIFIRRGYEWLRTHSSHYDVAISTQDVFPFPKRGIQYVHQLSLLAHSKLRGGNESVLGKRYWDLLNLLIPHSSRQKCSQNMTLCNSPWTKDVYEKFYCGHCEVITPPVRDDFPSIPYAARDNGFVCMGRLSKDKRQDLAIQFIDKLRERGNDVHLHVLGGGDSQYACKVKKESEKRSYVFFEGFVPRDTLTQIVASHKFGIHMKQVEHYGIVPAEMVRGGCIPLVPNSGGQKYIVLQNEKLLFNNFQQAVTKADRIINNLSLQNEILAELKSSNLNTPEAFREKIKRKVATFFD